MAYATEFQGTFFKHISFSIDAESLILDGTEMMCSEVTGFGYARTPVHGLYGAVAHYNYSFMFRDSSDDQVEVWFSKMKNLDLHAKDAYAAIIKEVWNAFGKRLLQDAVRTIASGGQIELLGTTIDQKGFHFTHKTMFGEEQQQTVSWYEIVFSTDEEKLFVESPYNKSFSAQWSYCKTGQARIVERLLLMTFHDPPFIKILTGSDQLNQS